MLGCMRMLGCMGMKIGYARVSTKDQNIHLQVNALQDAGCTNIYRERMSGSAKKERPVLKETLSFLREGDTFVVWRLDRLGRTLRQLIELVQDLEDRGVQFISLKENINTSTPSGKLFFHITGAFAEMERELIRERTIAGLEAARARGRKGGRKFKLTSNDVDKIKKMYESKTVEIVDICKMFRITKPTLYNYLKRERGDQHA